MRVMYDACSAARIPATAPMVAGYIYGNCAWSAADWARFPNAVKVRIATVASILDGDVLDVERSDATPDQAPGWVAQRRAAGAVPTVYTSASNVTALLAAFSAHQVAAPLLWIAAWDGLSQLPAPDVAKQFQSTPGAGYDVSIVADYWPGVDPAPAIATGGGPMHLVQLENTTTIYLLFEHTGKLIPVGDGDDVASWQKSGATGPQPFSQLMITNLIGASSVAVPAAG